MATTQELYNAATTAIHQLLQGAQSYSVGDFTYTFADLDKLRRLRNELANELQHEQAGMQRGPTFYPAHMRRR